MMEVSGMTHPSLIARENLQKETVVIQNCKDEVPGTQREKGHPIGGAYNY